MFLFLELCEDLFGLRTLILNILTPKMNFW